MIYIKDYISKAVRPSPTAGESARTSMFTHNNSPLPHKDIRKEKGTKCGKCGHKHSGTSVCSFNKSGDFLDLLKAESDEDKVKEAANTVTGIPGHKGGNPYHDEKGRFTTKENAASTTTGKGEGAVSADPEDNPKAGSGEGSHNDSLQRVNEIADDIEHASDPLNRVNQIADQVETQADPLNRVNEIADQVENEANENFRDYLPTSQGSDKIKDKVQKEQVRQPQVADPSTTANITGPKVAPGSATMPGKKVAPGSSTVANKPGANKQHKIDVDPNRELLDKIKPVNVRERAFGGVGTAPTPGPNESTVADVSMGEAESWKEFEDRDKFQKLQGQRMSANPESFEGGSAIPRSERGPSKLGKLHQDEYTDQGAKVSLAHQKEAINNALKQGMDPVSASLEGQKAWTEVHEAYSEAREQGIPLNQIEGNEKELAAAWRAKQPEKEAKPTNTIQLKPNKGQAQQLQEAVTQATASKDSAPAEQSVLEKVKQKEKYNKMYKRARKNGFSHEDAHAAANEYSGGSYEDEGEAEKPNLPRARGTGQKQTKGPGIPFSSAYRTGMAMGRGLGTQGGSIAPATTFAADRAHHLLNPKAKPNRKPAAPPSGSKTAKSIDSLFGA